MLTEANVEKFNDNGISDFRRRNDSNVSSHPTSSIQPPTEQLGHVEQQQQLVIAAAAATATATIATTTTY